MFANFSIIAGEVATADSGWRQHRPLLSSSSSLDVANEFLEILGLWLLSSKSWLPGNFLMIMWHVILDVFDRWMFAFFVFVDLRRLTCCAPLFLLLGVFFEILGVIFADFCISLTLPMFWDGDYGVFLTVPPKILIFSCVRPDCRQRWQQCARAKFWGLYHYNCRCFFCSLLLSTMFFDTCANHVCDDTFGLAFVVQVLKYRYLEK